MHLVCLNGSLEALQFLTSNGGKLNLREQESHYSCLHTAAMAGHVHIVEFLLQNPSVAVGTIL
jgi:ankyrin repeat protein